MSNDFQSETPIMAGQISRFNKIVVLNVIQQAKEISRADIVKKTGLSAPTVTRIVDSLINNEKLVEQVGPGESSGGRPPVIVRFCSDINYVIGIDLGRTHIHGIVANLDGETVFSKDTPVSVEGTFDHDIALVINLITDLISNSGVHPKRLLGIGLAVAGFVNQLTGKVEFSPNFGWSMVNVKALLEEEFNIPIFVDNVSRVMAMGELIYGLGQQLDDFIYVNIGYGIGAGIISQGKPYLGYDGFAGEIGHVKINNPAKLANESRKCVCGKTDCLECYASGRGIVQTVHQVIDNHPDSLILKLSEGDKHKITTKLIAQAAEDGDSLAIDILSDAATILGASLANVANTINPLAIIIGGKVALSGDFFFEKIKDEFSKITLPNVSRQIHIEKSQLIDDAAVKGAIAMILREILELNVLIK